MTTAPYFSLPLFSQPDRDRKQHARTQTNMAQASSLSLTTAGRDRSPPVFAPSWPLASHSGLWVGKAGRVTLASHGGRAVG